MLDQFISYANISKSKEKYVNLHRPEKAFDKIQHLFMIKTLMKIKIEGYFLVFQRSLVL